MITRIRMGCWSLFVNDLTCGEKFKNHNQGSVHYVRTVSRVGAKSNHAFAR